MVVGASAQTTARLGEPTPPIAEPTFLPRGKTTSVFDTPAPRRPLAPSIAERFASEVDEEPLYVVTAPRWQPGEPDWLDRRGPPLVEGLDDHVTDDLLLTPPPPDSLWQRWRERRREMRRQPGSWQWYPLYFEKFTGIIHVNEPVHDQIHNGTGNLFGGRWGWDFARYAGVETRLGYTRATLKDTLYPLIPSHENFLFWDAELLIYPFGDTKWRPFAMLGMGLVDLGFIDDRGREWHQDLITMPFSVGVKYRLDNHNALRFEVADNVIFGTNQGGNGQHVIHNIAVLFAFERRFGLPHRSYFPRRETSAWGRFKSWLATMHY